VLVSKLRTYLNEVVWQTYSNYGLICFADNVRNSLSLPVSLKEHCTYTHLWHTVFMIGCNPEFLTPYHIKFWMYGRYAMLRNKHFILILCYKIFILWLMFCPEGVRITRGCWITRVWMKFLLPPFFGRVGGWGWRGLQNVAVVPLHIAGQGATTEL